MSVSGLFLRERTRTLAHGSPDDVFGVESVIQNENEKGYGGAALRLG